MSEKWYKRRWSVLSRAQHDVLERLLSSTIQTYSVFCRWGRKKPENVHILKEKFTPPKTENKQSLSAPLLLMGGLGDSVSGALMLNGVHCVILLNVKWRRYGSGSAKNQYRPVDESFTVAAELKVLVRASTACQGCEYRPLKSIWVGSDELWPVSSVHLQHGAEQMMTDDYPKSLGVMLREDNWSIHRRSLNITVWPV